MHTLLVLALALGPVPVIGSCAASPPGGGVPPMTSARQPAPTLAPAPPRATPPRTADECRACNGAWALHGIATVESCNCRTGDGGKRCRDGADCQGMCIAAEEPQREVVEAGPPARGFFVGRCSDLVTVFGCNRLIESGAAAHGPVPLAEPPPLMCVD